MKYHESLLDVIGNTPLVRLSSMGRHLKPLMLAKLEFLNPGGSNKDRIGMKLIEAAEREGKLKAGGTIVEPTSGNTGIGLAMCAVRKGYKMIFTMPDKVSKEKENLLRAYGAETVRCPTNVEPEDPRSYYKVAERLTRETPGAFSPNQYHNTHNPQAHYETTGPEIWRDTDGRVTHYVAGMGTGGTISGVARFLKEKNPNVKVIGIDTVGSLYRHVFYKTEGPIHQYKIEGIGEDFIPSTMNLSLLDEVVTVGDRDAYQTVRQLARSESWLVGSSSGAVVYGAIQLAKTLTENDVVVMLLPDTGRNYISTAFNDDWLRQHDLM